MVTEGQPASLMINGLKQVARGQLYLGELKLREVPTVPANTSIAVELSFPDYIGENTLFLKDEVGRTISNKLEIFVQPAIMDYKEFENLRDQHIPGLIQSAGAEDTAAQTYPGATPAIEEETINFNIALLLEFSKALLGITRGVMNLLSYRIETERKHLKGHLRGSIRWSKTAVVRAQKGVDYSTVHISDIRKRKWNTPTNLLLVRFHMEVFMEAIFFRDEIDRREREKKAWSTIYNTPYVGLDPEMKERIDTLEAVLRVHKDVLSNLKLKPLILEAKNLPKESRVFNREAHDEAHRAKNRAYRDLVDLWKRFLAEYESYYEDVVQIHTRRMRDLYALWVATEIANALNLRGTARSLRQFHSPKRDIRLNYDAPGQVRQGWSDSILSMLFDDESGSEAESGGGGGGGGPELFLHYKGLEIYLEARYDLRSRPRPEDVYKVLAFMSNYKAPCGIILYPGPRLKLTYSREQGQVLAWIPFGPRSNIYEIANDYLKFAMENVADLYRFMEAGKPVAKLAELIEAAAAEYYATGGATTLPMTERWVPPPDEKLPVVEPEAPRPPRRRHRADEEPPGEPEKPSPTPELPFGPDTDTDTDTHISAQGQDSLDDEAEELPEMIEPTPEEALAMEAEAHEVRQAGALEGALEGGLPGGAPKPPMAPEGRKLDYPIRKRKPFDDEDIKEGAEPAPSERAGIATGGPDPGSDPDPGPGATGIPRRRRGHDPGPPMTPGEEPGIKPGTGRVGWTPAHTSRKEYEPITEEGESMHLSMDKLRELVHKVEDRAWTESTEWEEKREQAGQTGQTERAGQTGSKATPAPPAPTDEPFPGKLRPTDDPPKHPPTHFDDPKDMPELPEGSDWVGRQERRRWDKEPLEEAEDKDERSDKEFGSST